MKLFSLALVIVTLAGAATGADAGDADVVTRTLSAEGGGRYTDVNVAGLARMLAKKKFPLINVHSPYEGELEGTDLFIPFDQIEAHVSRLPADKRATIVLYCRSGAMSATSARTLVRLGYADVWNLDGGMIAWQHAGKPLVQKNRK